jgi:hypothetical protein
MALKDKRGNQLFKRITVKVFHPNGKAERVRVMPVKGNLFTEKTIDEILEHLSERLEASYPQHEFSLVELGADKFNFVCRGPKLAFKLETVAP